MLSGGGVIFIVQQKGGYCHREHVGGLHAGG